MAFLVAAILVTALVPSRGSSSARSQEETPAGPPPVEELLRRVREVQASDIEAWHGYRFRRRVVKENLDQEGRPKERTAKELIITPAKDGGFREALVSLDGEEPSRKAVKNHLEQREFTEKYLGLAGGEDGEAARRGFGLDQLVELYNPVLAGKESMGGEACWRIDFHPVPRKESGGRTADVIRQAMEGSLWVTRDGLHVVRAEARMVRPVSLFWILAKVHSLEVTLEQGQVGEGAWLPRRVVLDWDRRILFDRDHRIATWTYTEYSEHASVPATGD